MEYLDYQAIWQESEKLREPAHVPVPGPLALIHERARTGSLRAYWKKVLWNAAAVLVLAVIFTFAYQVFIGDKEEISGKLFTASQEVKAPYGTQIRLDLSDGTEVYLNSGSSLRFPVTFDGKETRTVKLSGEGFFTVSADKNRPFLLDAGFMTVRVTGTSFNVDAYPENRRITVALVEGKVILEKESDGETMKLAAMNPGEVAEYDQTVNKLRIVKNLGMEKFSAWTRGKIVFSNDPILTVVEKLENWYNVEIEIGDTKLDTYRFTGTFFDEPVEQVLHLLSISSGMEYSIVPARRLDDNTFSKRKIILRSKRI
jgi:ferric-dicitrate binding protein FerR (iron transport regulator)